jgi:methyl-accepting chemotaxis protein
MALLKLDDFAPDAPKKGDVEEVLSSDEYRRQIRSILATNGNVESLDSTLLIPVPDDHNNDLEHQNRKFHQAALGVKEQIRTDLKLALEVGHLRTEQVWRIVFKAVSQVSEELIEGERNLRILVKEALGAAIARQRESGSYGGAEITADIEGVIDGRSGNTSQIITNTEEEAKLLQAKLAAEENELEQHIHSLLAQFRELEASEMAGSKKSIESTIDTIKNSAEGITHTLDSLEQMTLSIQPVADSAQQATEVTSTASTTAEAGEVAMDLTVQSILSLRETVAQTATKVKRLGESSQQISKFVLLINQIALQTNMLAINASIEAARAGEAGRGFAVVAKEFGRLAAQSAAATKEIEQVVENIQRETSVVVRAMELGYYPGDRIEGTHLVKDTKKFQC